MVDEYNSIPKDDLEERFARLEEKVSKVSRIMTIWMAVLDNKFEPFGELVSSNEDVGSKDQVEDKDELEKEKVGSSNISY